MAGAPRDRASAIAPRCGVYVHVPFCAALCPYCDFAVVVGKADLQGRYLDALVEEAQAATGLLPEPAGSLFVGGGTPTLVDPGALARALGGVRAALAVAPDAEVTVEANPESLRADGVAAIGATRVSIGAQSFAPDVLRALGRTHAPEQTHAAVAAAREAGVRNVSLDLIYGGPGESDEDWERSLREALALEPDHLSCYALTIEERTPFGKAVAGGRMAAPDEDALARRYERACALLDEHGFVHYEISNWARPGCESRHNLVYWTQGDYVGLGLGAHSHVAGVRWWNTRALARYLDAPAHARDGEERLSARERAEEWLSLRMRLVEGLDLAEASARLGDAVADAARSLERDGLARVSEGWMRLTPRGMLLENEATLRLLAAATDAGDPAAR